MHEFSMFLFRGFVGGRLSLDCSRAFITPIFCAKEPLCDGIGIFFFLSKEHPYDGYCLIAFRPFQPLSVIRCRFSA